MRLVLASASPRRAALLYAAGVSFEVRPADLDETPLPGEAPRAYARRVARAKARAVHAHDGETVLAADTVVALGARILGKPDSTEAARAMLSDLSGRTHAVHTAVAVRVGTRIIGRTVTTRVRFRSLSEADIARYLATGEPYDKAGGYGIQGEGGALVARVVGSYTAVVGLPLEETLVLLDQARGALRGAGSPPPQKRAR